MSHLNVLYHEFRRQCVIILNPSVKRACPVHSVHLTALFMSEQYIQAGYLASV